MTDWTSDANEALTLSLGMHLRHKCEDTLLTSGPNFSSIVRSQEDKEALGKTSPIVNFTQILHILYVGRDYHMRGSAFRLGLLDLWRRRENIWLQ
jgi:hypothetical protein